MLYIGIISAFIISALVWLFKSEQQCRHAIALLLERFRDGLSGLLLRNCQNEKLLVKENSIKQQFNKVESLIVNYDDLRFYPVLDNLRVCCRLWSMFSKDVTSERYVQLFSSLDFDLQQVIDKFIKNLNLLLNANNQASTIGIEHDFALHLQQIRSQQLPPKLSIAKLVHAISVLEHLSLLDQSIVALSQIFPELNRANSVPDTLSNISSMR